jgi:hypothetical protein
MIAPVCVRSAMFRFKTIFEVYQLTTNTWGDEKALIYLASKLVYLRPLICILFREQFIF